MADNVGNKKAKDFGLDRPQVNESFHVKGMEHVDWGMKTRLSQIFDPHSGNTIMLAFDHGYIMGPTQGLERLDLAIPPLMEEADVLMGTRGALRTCIPPECKKAIALRCSAGSSVVSVDDDMSHEVIGVSIEDAIRMNATCMAIQTFIGDRGECQSIDNIVRTVDAGNRYGIPTLGVVAVGKKMERTKKFYSLATRMLAEFGCQMVKVYYCEDFEEVAAACPVPLVIAGGKKIPEAEALEMAHQAITRGAHGVDMGRNVFQAEDPKAMIKALRQVVHHGATGAQGYECYLDLMKN